MYITYNPNFLKFLRYKKKNRRLKCSTTINNCMLPKLSLSLCQLIKENKRNGTYVNLID